MSTYSIRIARTAADARPLEAAWARLGRDTLDPNVFYEDWQLLPALEQLVPGNDAAVEVAFIFRQGSNDAAPELCGVVPLERREQYRGRAMRTLRLWQHSYCYLCTPLVSRTDPLGVVGFFLDWLGGEQADCRLMEFNTIGGDGAFAGVLAEALASRRRPVWETGRHERALLKPQPDMQAFMDQIMSDKKKKELRRLERRLAELGAMSFESIGPASDLDAWLKEFLDLENSGWKREEASALAAKEHTRRYFETIVRAAHGRGQLEMHALRLDGRAIAMKCNFTSREGAYAFKISFDEAYAKYSPGVLLEIHNIERAHQQTRLEWMDSCAAPDHPMIDHLWPQSRIILSRTVATGRWLSNSLISTLALVQAAKRRVNGQVSRYRERQAS